MDRKEVILDTAFHIWGKTNFTQMSLTPIAKYLGITKAALYKHFRNKDELLKAMEKRFFIRYHAFHQEFFEELGDRTLSEAVRLFMEKVLNFYQQNPTFLSYFYIWLLRFRLLEHHELISLLQRQRDLFHTLFQREGIDLEEAELNHRLHFLYIFSTFWISTLYPNAADCKNRPSFSLEHLDNPQILREALSHWHHYCMHGFWKHTHTYHLSYHQIEQQISFHPLPRKENDRIFQAIVEVSQEVGIREASLERIAEKLGMSKSSLYSHFRNKRSMFEALLREEQRFLLGVLKHSIPALPRFPEKSYAFMYITTLHMLLSPSLLSVFNWLRFQNIRIPIRPPSRSFMEEYFSFFYEALDKGELVCQREHLIPSAVLLHVLTFRQLREAGEFIQLNEPLKEKIRAMHQLYLHGLATPHLSKESV